MSLRSVVSGCSKSAASFSVHGQQIFTKIGILKGLVCAVKKILKVDFRPTRTELIGLKDVCLVYNILAEKYVYLGVF